MQYNMDDSRYIDKMYGTTEILIDNPVLLEILTRYKRRGAFLSLFGTDMAPMIGNTICIYEPDYSSLFFAPDDLEEIADCILEMIQSRGIPGNRRLFRECRKELEESREEILKGYRKVKWESFDRCRYCDNYLPACRSWKFLYDYQENGPEEIFERLPFN